jgi:DNA-binding transcriptional MerR regulator
VARSDRQHAQPEVMNIKAAAELLGVCEMTLRRWDKAGRFRPHRHPVNGYRIYVRADVMRLRAEIEGGRAA